VDHYFRALIERDISLGSGTEVRARPEKMRKIVEAGEGDQSAN
jgi:hypothetical protein